jgi:hypothetical protein
MGRIGNFDCSSVDRDVPYPTARARSTNRNKRRFVNLGAWMLTSLVHIPIGTPLVSINGKALILLALPVKARPMRDIERVSHGLDAAVGGCTAT